MAACSDSTLSSLLALSEHALATELQNINLYAKVTSATVLEGFPGVRYREAGLRLLAARRTRGCGRWGSGLWLAL